MRTPVVIVMWVVVAGLAIGRVAAAQPAPPDVTDAEFKCMARTSKAEAKFWFTKMRCVYHCFDRFWDGDVPESDCMPPYGGATAQCIADSITHTRGVEDKLAYYVRSACDPTFKPGTQCPGCYDGGDCTQTGFAGDTVASFENEVDSFVPGVFCERAGAFILEQRCEKTTAKWLGKYAVSAGKCYDKCNANARKGITPFADCAPPAVDSTTAGCLSAAEAKAAYYIDHDCHAPPSIPDGCGGPYPSAQDWMSLIEVAVTGNVAATYCASPSGAFID